MHTLLQITQTPPRTSPAPKQYTQHQKKTEAEDISYMILTAVEISTVNQVYSKKTSENK